MNRRSLLRGIVGAIASIPLSRALGSVTAPEEVPVDDALLSKFAAMADAFGAAHVPATDRVVVVDADGYEALLANATETIQREMDKKTIDEIRGFSVQRAERFP